MNDLTNRIADSTGISVQDVSRCIEELAKVAYAEAGSGFVLPGFGKFSVVAGPETKGVNPFTGETKIFAGPPEVQFTVDTKAKQAFLRGKSEEVPSTSSQNANESLLPIKLVPDAEDSLAAGLSDRQFADSEFKVGGTPDWLQAPSTPVCCGEPMLFYGQLDSLGGDYAIADMGRLYVFLCKSCTSSQSILQF